MGSAPNLLRKKNHSVNRLKRDLCIGTIFNPPLFSLIITFKTNNISIYTESQKLLHLRLLECVKYWTEECWHAVLTFFIIIEKFLKPSLTGWPAESVTVPLIPVWTWTYFNNNNLKNFFKNRVQIQKEVISDLKRENQFLPKEIWESIWLISRERERERGREREREREICIPVLKLDFRAHGIKEFL